MEKITLTAFEDKEEGSATSAFKRDLTDLTNAKSAGLRLGVSYPILRFVIPSVTLHVEARLYVKVYFKNRHFRLEFSLTALEIHGRVSVAVDYFHPIALLWEPVVEELVLDLEVKKYCVYGNVY